MKPLLSYEKIKEYVKRTYTKRIRPLNRVEKDRGEYYLPPPDPFFLPPFFLPPFLPPHLAIVFTSYLFYFFCITKIYPSYTGFQFSPITINFYNCECIALMNFICFFKIYPRAFSNIQFVSSNPIYTF